MKKIGFFGGSFDPIHFGHLYLAMQMLEMHKLDEILLCPAYCSPFKTARPPHASPEHRLAMLQAAVAEIPHFRVSSYEVERREISYTIDTLRNLQEPGIFHLILSDEAASHFHQWKEPEELIRLAPPFIGVRSASHLTGKMAEALRPGFTETKAFPISSTEIRERLKKELYCGHLVPANALEYIRANSLYLA